MLLSFQATTQLKLEKKNNYTSFACISTEVAYRLDPPTHINAQPPTHINAQPPTHMNAQPPTHMKTTRRLFLKYSPISAMSGAIFAGLIAAPGIANADTTDTTEETTEEQTTTTWGVQFKIKVTQLQRSYVSSVYAGFDQQSAMNTALDEANGGGAVWEDEGAPVSVVLPANSAEVASTSAVDSDGVTATAYSVGEYLLEGYFRRTVVTITDFY
jgi:hypothetical protein